MSMGGGLPLKASLKDSGPWDSARAKLEARADDFEAWQELLMATGALDGGLTRFSSAPALELFRLSYEHFLAKFPLCHGHWMNYAQGEFNVGCIDRALDVYCRAINTVPASVTLWTSYLDFYMTTHPKEPAKVRALFRTASHFIGSHFLASPFWNQYLEFETREDEIEGGKFHRVLKLLDHVVRLPLHQYALYFSNLADMLKSLPLDVVLSPHLADQFAAEFEIELQESTVKEADREKDYRERLISHYIEIYLSTQARVAERFEFEISLRRPFFHVAYVSESDMVAWRKYLHFEEVEAIDNPKHHQTVKMLYERALLPTGHREEFWLRYFRWLLAHEYFGDARNVLRRAVAVLPVSALETRHIYGKFESSLGNYRVASEIYSSILAKFPSSFETLELYANLHEKCIHGSSGLDFVNELAWTTTDRDAQLYIGLLMAEKYTPVVNQARAVFQQLIQKYPESFRVWRSYVDFEIRSKEESHLRDVIQQLESTSTLKFAEKKQIIHLYMIYLLDQSDNGLSEYLRLDGVYNK